MAIDPYIPLLKATELFVKVADKAQRELTGEQYQLQVLTCLCILLESLHTNPEGLALRIVEEIKEKRIEKLTGGHGQ